MSLRLNKVGKREDRFHNDKRRYPIMSVTTISDIKGLAPEVKAKLESAGIKNTSQLLEHTQTQKQRTELAYKVGTTPEAMKDLANRADLMRLNGIGGDFSNLLEVAGVNSCKELQHRVPEKLHTTLVEIHTSQKIGHHAPSLVQTTEWITEAKKLAVTSPA
jgi:predicted flap endonuclease-1-like 5' DNA nuclease